MAPELAALLAVAVLVAGWPVVAVIRVVPAADHAGNRRTEVASVIAF